MEQQMAGVLEAARLWAPVTWYLQAIRAEVSVPVAPLALGEWEGGSARLCPLPLEA